MTVVLNLTCSILWVFIFATLDVIARWLRGQLPCRQLCHWGLHWLDSRRQSLTRTPSLNFDLVSKDWFCVDFVWVLKSTCKDTNSIRSCCCCAFRCSGLSVIVALKFISLLHTTSYVWYCCYYFNVGLPSVLWHCWLGGRKGIRPIKI